MRSGEHISGIRLIYPKLGRIYKWNKKKYREMNISSSDTVEKMRKNILIITLKITIINIKITV